MAQVQDIGGDELEAGFSAASGADVHWGQSRRRRISRFKAEEGLKVQFWSGGTAQGDGDIWLVCILTYVIDRKGNP